MKSEEEYERALALAERLHFTKNRTPEERALYKLLVILIEAKRKTTEEILSCLEQSYLNW